MSNPKKLTLLVDDDPICNSISKVLLNKKFKSAQSDFHSEFEIVSLVNPVEGLKFLTESLLEKKYSTILVLLDINMPVMTGWEFLAEYEALFQNQEEVSIYILSSSVSKSDTERAAQNPNVVDFISKPITPPEVEKLYEKIK